MKIRDKIKGIGLTYLTIFQLYQSVLWVEETGVPGENHQPAISH